MRGDVWKGEGEMWYEFEGCLFLLEAGLGVLLNGTWYSCVVDKGFEDLNFQPLGTLDS